MKNNLIIKGAKIFDGISSEPRFADIAVAEGNIDKIEVFYALIKDTKVMNTFQVLEQG